MIANEAEPMITVACVCETARYDTAPHFCCLDSRYIVLTVVCSMQAMARLVLILLEDTNQIRPI